MYKVVHTIQQCVQIIELLYENGHSMNINQDKLFQQNGDTSHSGDKTIKLLKENFDGRVIPRILIGHPDHVI